MSCVCYDKQYNCIIQTESKHNYIVITLLLEISSQQHNYYEFLNLNIKIYINMISLIYIDLFNGHTDH